MNKSFLFSLLMLLAFAPGISAQQDDSRQETYKNLETFSNILTLLQEHYVDEIDVNTVITGAVNGMLSALDPHSSYLRPEDFKEIHEETQGSYSGIGLEITVRDHMLTVVSPIEGTPAYLKGIQAGDQIIRIDGQSTKNISIMDTVKKLRGKKGTTVIITIYREEWSEMRDVELVRAEIPLHSVRSEDLGEGLLYTRITNFQTSTTADFKKIFRQAEKKSPVLGMILDLRDNPGGLLDQAIKIADIFIDEGVLVSTKGRQADQDMIFEAHRGTGRFEFPLVVLVNGGSASASEIVAGALQDHGRAIVVGTSTFGKGSVQTIIPLPDGAGLRLTTAKYYTPSGDSIQATGIQPDMIVPRIASEDITSDQEGAAHLKERDLPGHFKEELNGSTSLSDTKDSEDSEKEQEKIKKLLLRDNQLHTALMILKSLKLANKNQS